MPDIRVPIPQPPPKSPKSNGMFDRRWKPPVVIYQKTPENTHSECTCHSALLKEVQELKACYEELRARLHKMEDAQWLACQVTETDNVNLAGPDDMDYDRCE
ncbi:hypothetical protein BFJ70_g9855 [Fusarium oxysporum]|nr:hypothetical protein BFJ70_g9855 [Fusarium oxysporum]